MERRQKRPAKRLEVVERRHTRAVRLHQLEKMSYPANEKNRHASIIANSLGFKKVNWPQTDGSIEFLTRWMRQRRMLLGEGAKYLKSIKRATGYLSPELEQKIMELFTKDQLVEGFLEKIQKKRQRELGKRLVVNDTQTKP